MELVECYKCGKTAEAGEVAGVDMVELASRKIVCLACLNPEKCEHGSIDGQCSACMYAANE